MPPAGGRSSSPLGPPTHWGQRARSEGHGGELARGWLQTGPGAETGGFEPRRFSVPELARARAPLLGWRGAAPCPAAATPGLLPALRWAGRALSPPRGTHRLCGPGAERAAAAAAMPGPALAAGPGSLLLPLLLHAPRLQRWQLLPAPLLSAPWPPPCPPAGPRLPAARKRGPAPPARSARLRPAAAPGGAGSPRRFSGLCGRPDLTHPLRPSPLVLSIRHPTPSCPHDGPPTGGKSGSRTHLKNGFSLTGGEPGTLPLPARSCSTHLPPALQWGWERGGTVLGRPAEKG